MIGEGIALFLNTKIKDMKKSKLLKLENSKPKLLSKKMLLPKSQLKGIKGGIVEEDAEGI